MREVEDGLLHMLEDDDSSMWPVVRQHTSLLPMFNRVHCLLALHDELLYVVAPVDLNGYWRVLGQLDFPNNWHSVISQNMYFIFLFLLLSVDDHHIDRYLHAHLCFNSLRVC